MLRIMVVRKTSSVLAIKIVICIGQRRGHSLYIMNITIASLHLSLLRLDSSGNHSYSEECKQ
uniref:Uncharacterized protein n=1 Tax=Anguilla anguilla TaxID=7936 RepID=A0A0E9UTA1_ANGAN